jgi:hypothetical protein
MNTIIECLLLITFINICFYNLLDSQIFALYMLFNIYGFIEFISKYSNHLNKTFDVILLYIMILLHIFLIVKN